MIAAALRDEIDSYAARMRTANPLFFKAADGTLGLDSVSFYLANLRHLLRSTQRQIARARDLAAAAGDATLAAHYRHKHGEEEGHDKWADRDLERLRASALAGDPPGASMTGLIHWVDAIIEEDPALYLAYALFAETLVVLLGPEWLTLLETRCNVPRTAMTAIGNHVELDREHSEEAMDEIDRLVGDPKKLRRMREVVREAIVHFDRFCVEVCDRPMQRVHVPAA
jgi:hypothetical protein